MKVLEVFSTPGFFVIVIGVFAILASSSRQVGSWRAIFVPMYVADVCWLFALYQHWKKPAANPRQRKELRSAVFLVVLMGKLAFDIALPLRLDGNIDISYVYACLPLVLSLIILVVTIALDTRSSVATLS
jgi:hypothetical protein